jgi:hypothetical protein
MKLDEVPQENNATLAGERKLVYALGDSGRYTGIASSGSKVEETVTCQAIEEFHRLRDEVRSRVTAGSASTLEYHMYALRMDPATLAQSVGMFGWRVRHHLKPAVFPSLKPKLLQRYADVLGLSVAELFVLPPEDSTDK